MQADDSQRQLLGLNGLDYRLAPSLSVATQRTHRSFPATRAAFDNGNTMQFVMASGASYVDCKESYLAFDLEVDVTVASGTFVGAGHVLSFGAQTQTEADSARALDKYGSAGNLFSQFRWVHAAGTELERVEQLAPWIRHTRDWGHSEQWLDTTGATSGLDATDEIGSVVAGTPVTKTYKRLIVPLSEISDAFNQDQLMPSFLAAGSQLEFQLESPAKAMTIIKLSDQTPVTQGVAVNIPTVSAYRIKNPAIVLATITLTDSIQRALSNISASSGLEYPFEAIFTQGAAASNQSVSIQISRALSRANKIWAFVTDTSRVASDGKENSTTGTFPVAADLPDDQKFQLQLGAEFIPTRPIQGLNEAYTHALAAFGHLRARTGDCSVYPWKLGVAPAGATAGVNECRGSLGVMAVSLERSSTLSQSGSAISAQRTANFNIEFGKADDVASRRLICYVHYVKLVTVFLDNAVVRS